MAGVFVLLTGLYLTWYWYSDITDKSSNVVTGAVSWQEELSRFVQRNQTSVVVFTSVIIVIAIAFSILVKRKAAHPE